MRIRRSNPSGSSQDEVQVQDALSEEEAQIIKIGIRSRRLSENLDRKIPEDVPKFPSSVSSSTKKKKQTFSWYQAQQEEAEEDLINQYDKSESISWYQTPSRRNSEVTLQRTKFR